MKMPKFQDAHRGPGRATGGIKFRGEERVFAEERCKEVVISQAKRIKEI